MSLVIVFGMGFGVQYQNPYEKKDVVTEAEEQKDEQKSEGWTLRYPIRLFWKEENHE